MNSSNSAFLCRPIVQDYIELGCLVVFFLCGAPVNLHVYQLLRRKKKTQLPKSFQMLQKQLNLTDLMIMFIYVPSRICEILTSYWQAGAILCKVVHFGELFCFQMSSNIIILLAIDRMLKPNQRSSKLTTRIIISLAYVVGIGISIPQFFVWELHGGPDGKPHCDSIFKMKWIYLKKCMLPGATCSPESIDQADYFVNTISQLAALFHGLVQFIIPAIIVVFCYTVLMCQAYWVRSRHREVEFVTEVDTPEARRRHVSFKQHRESLLSRLRGKTNSLPRSKNGSVLPDEPDAVARNRAHTGSGSALQVNKVSHAKAFRRALALVLVFIICWIPYAVINFSSLFSKQATCSKFLSSLIVFNAVLNPYLYAIKLKRCNCFRL